MENKTATLYSDYYIHGLLPCEATLKEIPSQHRTRDDRVVIGVYIGHNGIKIPTFFL